MDPALNNVTVDGASMTTLGTNRSFELQSITGAMFEALELIKGHTPTRARTPSAARSTSRRAPPSR
jgi:hypothetical protein